MIYYNVKVTCADAHGSELTDERYFLFATVPEAFAFINGIHFVQGLEASYVKDVHITEVRKKDSDG